MDCESVERLLPMYTLGSMSGSVSARFFEHVDACESCAARARDAGETLVKLASVVPQISPPVRVKEALLARLKAHPRAAASAAGRRAPRAFLPFPANAIAAAVLAVAVIAVVGAGYWQSRGLQDVSVPQPESVSVQAQDARQGMEQQAKLFDSIAKDPSVTVKRLSADIPAAQGGGDDSPTGVIIISEKENVATIAARRLPQLPPTQVYGIRLIKHGGLEVRAATLTVDSTGAGQAEIALDAPLKDFRAVLITIDEVTESRGVRKNSALRVDL